MRGEVHAPPQTYGLHRLQTLLQEKNMLSDNERKSLRRYSGANNKKFMKIRRKGTKIQDEEDDDDDGVANNETHGGISANSAQRNSKLGNDDDFTSGRGFSSS